MILLGSQISDVLGPFEDEIASDDPKEEQQHDLHGDKTDSFLAQHSSVSLEDTQDHHSYNQNTKTMRLTTPVSSPKGFRPAVISTRQQPMTQRSYQKLSSLNSNVRRKMFDATHKQESSYTLCATTVSSLGLDSEHVGNNDTCTTSISGTSSADSERYWLLRIPTYSNLTSSLLTSKTSVFISGCVTARVLSTLPFEIQVGFLVVGISITWWMSRDASLNDDTSSAHGNMTQHVLDGHLPNDNEPHTEGLTLLPVSSPLTFEGRNSYDETSVLAEDFLTPPMTPDIRFRSNGTGQSPRRVQMSDLDNSYYHHAADTNNDLELLKLHRSETLGHLGRIHAPFPNMEQDEELLNRVTPTALKLCSNFVRVQADFLVNVDAAIQIIQTATGMQCGVGPFSTSVARVERAMVTRFAKVQEEQCGSEFHDGVSAQQIKMASSSSSLQRLKLELFQMMLLCLKNLNDLLKLLPTLNSVHNNSSGSSPVSHCETLDCDPTVYHLQSILDSIRRSYFSADEGGKKGHGVSPIATTVTLSFLTDCRQQLAARLSRFVGRVFRPVSPSHSNPIAVVGLCRRLKEVTTSTNDMTLYLGQAVPNHESRIESLTSMKAPSNAKNNDESKEFAMLLAKLDAACVALWCARCHEDTDAFLNLNMKQIRRDILGEDEGGADQNMKNNDNDLEAAKQISLWLGHGKELLLQSMTLCEGILSRTSIETDANAHRTSICSNNAYVDVEDTVQEYEGESNNDGTESCKQLPETGFSVDDELQCRQQKDHSLVLVYSGRSTEVSSIDHARRKRILRTDFSDPSNTENPSLLFNELRNRLKLFDSLNEVNANDSENDEDDTQHSEHTPCGTPSDFASHRMSESSLNSRNRYKVSTVADGLTFGSATTNPMARNFLSELTQAQETFATEDDDIAASTFD